MCGRSARVTKANIEGSKVVTSCSRLLRRDQPRRPWPHRPRHAVMRRSADSGRTWRVERARSRRSPRVFLRRGSDLWYREGGSKLEILPAFLRIFHGLRARSGEPLRRTRGYKVCIYSFIYRPCCSACSGSTTTTRLEGAWRAYACMPYIDR